MNTSRTTATTQAYLIRFVTANRRSTVPCPYLTESDGSSELSAIDVNVSLDKILSTVSWTFFVSTSVMT